MHLNWVYVCNVECEENIYVAGMAGYKQTSNAGKMGPCDLIVFGSTHPQYCILAR